MARGSESQPSDKHWGAGTVCLVVFYEDDDHGSVSQANPKSFCQGQRPEYWQSHHLVCITTVAPANRKLGDATREQQLEKSLYITDWNINKAPNMLGMPMKLHYLEKYGDIAKLPQAAQDAAWGAVQPKNIPAHNVDHNGTGSYTKEVTDYLITNVWNKFKAKGGDHAIDAKWLADELKDASEVHQDLLLDVRGIRENGTVDAWKARFSNKRWADPFSMAACPNLRKPGRSFFDLTDIFVKIASS